MNANVKVMNSYDYCHFEVQLSAENVTLADVDNLRKEAQRLVDKSIKQYKIAKRMLASDFTPSQELILKVKAINKNFPKSEWSPEQQAIIKEYEDRIFRASLSYDYQDNWDYEDAA